MNTSPLLLRKNAGFWEEEVVEVVMVVEVLDVVLGMMVVSYDG